MRTIQGPFCGHCGDEVRRVETTNQFGYVHGKWLHVNAAVQCSRADAQWRKVVENG